MDQTPLPTEQADPQLLDATTPIPQVPSEQSEPDGNQSSVDFAAERDALLAERDQLAREAEIVREQNQRYEAHMAQQAAVAWKQAEQQMLAHVQTLDPDDALRRTAAFYNQREQALIGTIQQRDQRLHEEKVLAYADYLSREYELNEADKTRLLWVGQRDANAMLSEAEKIKVESQGGNSRIAELEQKIEQLTRATQANQMRTSGAWQTGGGNPQPLDPNIKPGSPEHLKTLLGMPT